MPVLRCLNEWLRRCVRVIGRFGQENDSPSDRHAFSGFAAAINACVRHGPGSNREATFYGPRRCRWQPGLRSATTGAAHVPRMRRSVQRTIGSTSISRTFHQHQHSQSWRCCWGNMVTASRKSLTHWLSQAEPQFPPRQCLPSSRSRSRSRSRSHSRSQHLAQTAPCTIQRPPHHCSTADFRSIGSVNPLRCSKGWHPARLFEQRQGLLF